MGADILSASDCLLPPYRHQHGWRAKAQQTQGAKESSICHIQVGRSVLFVCLWVGLVPLSTEGVNTGGDGMPSLEFGEVFGDEGLRRVG